MSWIKVDDQFLDHPKFLSAGPLAGYLCLCGIAWSNRNRTDGFIPRAQVRRFVDFEGFAHRMWMGDFAGGGEDVDAMALAEELVAVGLWEHAEGGYRIHDYHDWQRSADEITRLSEQRRTAGQRSAEIRGASKPLNGSPNKSSNASLNNSSATCSTEVRSKKEEEPPPLTPPPAGGRARNKKDWEENAVAWAASSGVTGHRASVVKAVRGCGPWKADDAPAALRAHVQKFFPTLTVADSSEEAA